MTITPTPDSRVIELGPEELLLREKDLPEEANYHLKDSSDIYHYSNSEVINEWGNEEGTDYIKKTGRIDGWVVRYTPDLTTGILPVFITQNLIRFESHEGAKLALEIHPSKEELDWEIIDEDHDLGDSTRILKIKSKQRKWGILLCYVSSGNCSSKL